jgi:hypothetical protein
VASPLRQIFAFSGVLDSGAGKKGSYALVEHAVALAARAKPTQATPDRAKPTRAAPDRAAPDRAAPDRATRDGAPPDRAGQDLVLVEGGSVVNLMALWRAHGLPGILRRCWAAGVVLAGVSAGSLCWHVGGPTDSFSDRLDPFTGGLGLLPYSNGVHDDFPGQRRREVYRAMVAQGVLPGGQATEGGTGLHYEGTTLHEAVSIRPGKRAWPVGPGPGGSYTDEPIEPRAI